MVLLSMNRTIAEKRGRVNYIIAKAFDHKGRRGNALGREGIPPLVPDQRRFSRYNIRTPNLMSENPFGSQSLCPPTEVVSSRRAKIICTIGPSCRTEPALRELMQLGMDVARLNFSHGPHADHAQSIES